MAWDVLNTAVDECPAWCEGRCDPDLDGSVWHSSALLQLAGPIVREGDVPVAWLQAGAARGPGQVLPEPTFNIYSSSDDYELTADGVRMFAAVLLRQLERITGPAQDVPRPTSLDAVMRGYGPVLDDRGQVADLDGHEPQNR